MKSYPYVSNQKSKENEVKTMLYCKNCLTWFKSDRIIIADKTCPIYDCCDENIQEIDERIYDIIRLLNHNRYFVYEICFQENEITISFNGERDFESLPKGFDVIYYSDCVEIPDEIIATEIYYAEKNMNKTQEQLSEIAEDLEKWVNSICRPIF